MSLGQALLQVAREGLLLVLLLSGPAVGAALIAGLLTAILQAATQVHEVTIGFAPKLVAVAVALVVFAPWIGRQLEAFTASVLALLPAVGGS